MKRAVRRPASSPAEGSSEPRPWPPWAAGAALALMTIVAYSPAFQAGYIWDDDDYVYENPNLGSAAGLRDIWLSPRSSPQYYPLVFTTFWLEHHLWGLAPAGYHAVNVLLHAANALLLWRVLLRLSVPGAWIAAAVFALHPVHVESVAWITERKNTLSGFFYLLSALLFLRAALAVPALPPRRHLVWSGAALACFVAALLSKTVAASLPAALLLVLWWKRGHLVRWDLVATAPMFLLGVPLGLWTAQLERSHVKAVGAEWSYTFLERVLIACRALWFYAAKIVWPSELTFIYPKWRIDDTVWWQYLYVAAAVAAIGGLWYWRARIGRHWLAGVLFFAGTLFPALGFFNIYPMRYSLVADHFQYLASIGLITLLTGVATAWCRGQSSARWHVPAAGLLLIVLGVLTWMQCLIYVDAETVWRDTLRKNPACEMAHTNLGLLLHQAGVTEEAAKHFQAALVLAPDEAEPHNNWAMALIAQGLLDEAQPHLDKALALRPDYAEAHTNQAIVWIRRGQLDQAEAEFRLAARAAPDDPVVRFNLAKLLHDRRQWAAAEREYREVLRISPEHIPAHWNLATLLVEIREYDAAIAQLEGLLKMEPTMKQAEELLRIARQAAASPDSSGP